jgi:tetratricopeptide (TPR) repeat protein
MADNPRINELRRRIDLDPASIAFAALAEEYRRAGFFDEAIATCEAGLKRHPSYLSARVTLGRALIEVGRYEDAREHLEFVVRAAPENLAAIRGLAEIHNRRRDTEFKTRNEADMPAALPVAGAHVSSGPPRDPALDAQVHALEAFLHAVERARTGVPAAL